LNICTAVAEIGTEWSRTPVTVRRRGFINASHSL